MALASLTVLGGCDGGIDGDTVGACSALQGHIAASVIQPGGEPLAFEEADITGTVTAVGLGMSPAGKCGASAWVSIAATGGGGEWLACFLVPDFTIALSMGDAVELTRSVSVGDIDPSSFRTTLRASGQLVIDLEDVADTGDLALPEGITLADGELLCESKPTDGGCGTKRHVATISLGSESVEIPPGESGVVGGYRVDVDQNDDITSDGGCDSGSAHIVIAVLPVPAI